MSASRSKTGREIDKAAALWCVRVDGGRMSDADARDLDAWLEADVRHRGAFARAQAVMARAERARALGAGVSVAESPDAVRATRRRVLMVGGGLAACLAGVVAWRIEAALAPLVLKSSKGEVLRVPLADGSSVTLNTNTELHVRYSRHSRDLELLAGEALFNLRDDRARPFVVRAGAMSLRGGASVFSVRNDRDAPVCMVVRDGTVELTCGQRKPMLIPANYMVKAAATTISADAPLESSRMESQEIARRLAWEDGMLSFKGETLAKAVDEFARYSDTRLVIDDPELAQETVSGRFSSSDPARFAQAVAVSFNARVIDADGALHISR
ncbi:MAG TPA: FecR domain-containing protein [Caulobacteraceae bacterium]|nr:FecR domain-containing protein [Caulobacteraceae bacterium]